jgi:hypothetical protein
VVYTKKTAPARLTGRQCAFMPGRRFYGALNSARRAVGVCLAFGLPVFFLRRIWLVISNERTVPYREIVFREHVLERLC